MAKKMGLKIDHFIASTNANTAFPDYLSTGHYKPNRTIATIANAMDVGDPSNFSRILSLYEGEGSTWNNIKKELSSQSFLDHKIIEGIKEIKQRYNYEIDPHGSTAYLAYKNYLLKHPKTFSVILETAHPAKFDLEIPNFSYSATPAKLNAFRSKQSNSIKCSAKYDDFKAFLNKHSST